MSKKILLIMLVLVLSISICNITSYATEAEMYYYDKYSVSKSHWGEETLIQESTLSYNAQYLIPGSYKSDAARIFIRESPFLIRNYLDFRVGQEDDTNADEGVATSVPVWIGTKYIKQDIYTEQFTKYGTFYGVSNFSGVAYYVKFTSYGEDTGGEVGTSSSAEKNEKLIVTIGGKIKYLPLKVSIYGRKLIPEEYSYAETFIAEDGTYPDDGISQDGYYYIKREQTTLPHINFSHKTNWTNKNVVITATATDVNGVSKIVLPDNTEVNGDTATYTIIKNGMYVFKAENNDGNIVEETVEITNIDKVKPTMVITVGK
jgi:hypothetical protein